MTEIRYAVIVSSRQAKAFDGAIRTKHGEEFWIMIAHDGWAAATSSRFCGMSQVPGDVKPFDTRAEAEEFAKRWKGHPWWCDANGTFRIVEIVPHMITIQRGWDLA